MEKVHKPMLFVVAFGVLFLSCKRTDDRTASVATGTGVNTPSPGPLTIDGAGATFPYPLYSRWAYEYAKQSGTKINYQSIGSGGGIAQIQAKTIDFGASDAPLKPDELESAGLVQFPLIIGGVVPVVHLDGVPPGVLRLDGEALARIYLGRITKWNDPSLKALNPDVPLPEADIAVVHRADGSGTTWIFTNYLSKVSREWSDSVGNGRAVDWPAGMGGKGNEGVAAYVQRVKGAIGYVEFAYALQNDLSHVRLKNRDNRFVEPSMNAFKAAAESADWADAEGFFLVLTDQPGAASWPITGASFILVHRDMEDEQMAREALKFFEWCYDHGGEVAATLHYVRIPENVVALVKTLWEETLRAGGKPVRR